MSEERNIRNENIAKKKKKKKNGQETKYQ